MTYAPETQTSWRNISRHEHTFDEALYANLRRTPWWLISIGFHVLFAGLLLQIEFTSGGVPRSAMARAAIEENEIQPLQEEVKPDLTDTRPIDQPEEVVYEQPMDADVPVDDHNETDNDQITEETLGERDFLSNAPFEGLSRNSAMGIGGGAGGAFGGRGGHRNLRAGGGGKRTQNAADLGLEWLENHQDPDGFWDCDGFMAQCKLNQCDGAGNALYDPGVSGLALLAFLGAGETHRHGHYKATVKAGLKYLKQVQDPEGCFGPRTTTHFTYNHAIGALAMAEAYGLTGSPLFKQSAQQAIDFIGKCQNPYLAWRYGVRPGDNDTSVTGWMVMALKSAKLAGLRVDEATFDGTRAWIEKATEPEYGRVGYTARGTGPARPQDLMDAFPADRSESLTAVGMLARIFTGEDPRRSEMIQKGTDLCLKALPRWDTSDGSIDMYYWYYGTLALFQVGGDAWRAWNDAMKDAIIDRQRKDGDEKGSWDPVGPWGREGGRVYSTAVCVMCMEVYYRYGRVFTGDR